MLKCFLIALFALIVNTQITSADSSFFDKAKTLDNCSALADTQIRVLFKKIDGVSAEEQIGRLPKEMVAKLYFESNYMGYGEAFKTVLSGYDDCAMKKSMEQQTTWACRIINHDRLVVIDYINNKQSKRTVKNELKKIESYKDNGELLDKKFSEIDEMYSSYKNGGYEKLMSDTAILVTNCITYSYGKKEYAFKGK